MQAADTMRDWGNDSPVMELREVKGNEVLLLDETLPLTPKQLWKLVYDLNFIQQFYLKKGNREIGIGSWQKTGGPCSSNNFSTQCLLKIIYTLRDINSLAASIKLFADNIELAS
jgi:hypothetical protein